jgi:hypothetical protein
MVTKEEVALGKKIRRRARAKGLSASSAHMPDGYGNRDRKWYIANENNFLVSDERGLDDEDALKFIDEED